MGWSVKRIEWQVYRVRLVVSHEEEGVSCDSGVRLVREQMLEESGRSSRGILVLGAASENMVGGATEHTTAKTQRVAALKVGKWVSTLQTADTLKTPFFTIIAIFYGNILCNPFAITVYGLSLP